MIYYLKRLNSHIGSAETFNIRVSKTAAIPLGVICSIDSEFLTTYRNYDKPMYLTLEGKDENDYTKTTVSCVRLAPEMVLKAEALDDTSNYRIGDMCAISADMEEIVCGVTRSGTDAEIIAIEGNLITIILK